MDFQQLAHELNNYCQSLSEQIVAIYALSESKDSNTVVMGLDTTGFPAVDAAINNTEFLHAACRSLTEEYQYEQCAKGAFSFLNELIGLKNAVTLYNNTHSRTTLYMITSDSQFVSLYVQKLL